tara:strand:+ start:50 stop:226 length:177 start_codon:yes stop_codon:yes gene_type:complete
MNINININKDGLSTKECTKLAECLEFFNTDDIIGLLEGNEHQFKIGEDTIVKVKRAYK